MKNVKLDTGADQWRALALCFSVTLAIFIPYVGYATQIPAMMQDLGMTYTMVGTLASASALAGGIVVAFAGVLVDRWGAKNVTVLGLAINVLGQIAFAYAPTYETMLLARLLQGAGIPLLFLGPYTLAMRWAESSDRLGIFMGTMLATDGIGTVAALYGYAIILQDYGWRSGSLIGAAILVFATVVAFAMLKEPPDYRQSNVTRAASFAETMANYVGVVSHRNVIIAALFLTGVWGTYSIAIYWVPTILMEENGWTEQASGIVGSLYPLVGMICAVGFGLISDRVGRRKPLILISGIGMTASFVGAAFALWSQQYWLLATMLPISGLFAYGGLPLAYCLAADSVGVALAATANGFIMGVGFIVGGVLYPLVLGYVKDATSLYTVGFIAAAASLILLNVAAVLAARDAKTSSAETANAIA
ncbi:MFS family permease [Sinorhizobium fredii]|uniref:Putative major facilitator superfamily (MFS) transporter n=1 Tax=Sinorhizobium fredii (strain USDA 257) TaxID=1185652 RepID=I3X365_SINF2|nr:MFS transporter [Sinorhizobium fredii]AFL50321.1 putative major facilitator superfamily (MFS) transporter [Sinorhizobium fredii USDA 257]